MDEHEDGQFGNPVEAAPRKTRRPWIWALFVLLFLTLTYAQLSSYFASTPPKGQDYSNQIQLLGLHATNTAIAQLTGKKVFDDTERQKLVEIQAKVKPFKSKSIEAAKIYLVTSRELGTEVSADDLKILKRSTKANRSFAEIYESDRLTLDRAAELAEAIGRDNYVDALAGVHALELAGDQEARGRAFIPAVIVMAVFAVVGLILGLVGFGILMWFLRQRSLGNFKPVGFPLGFASAFDVESVILTVTLLLGILFLLPDLLPEGLQSSAFPLIIVGFILVFQLRGAGRYLSLKQIFGPQRPLVYSVKWGALTWIANIPIMAALFVVSIALQNYLPEPTHPVVEELRMAKGPTLVAIAIYMCVIAPAVEEFIFRGLLAPALSKTFRSTLYGILLSSLLFGMIHPQGIVMWLPLASVGAACAFVSYQTGSLVPAILLHMIHNSALLTVFLVTRAAG